MASDHALCFDISDLTSESIEDAVAYWLYSDDERWERWRFVPGSTAIAPNRRVLRLAFESDGDTFELALVQRESRLFAKYDGHEDPEQEFPARVFAAYDEAIVTLRGDQRRGFPDDQRLLQRPPLRRDPRARAPPFLFETITASGTAAFRKYHDHRCP